MMQAIEERIDHIDEEIRGAMEYAEKYVVFKKTRPQWAQLYHDMAVQELNHAENLKDIAQEAMDEYSYIPEEDAEKWREKQKLHAEKKAMVKLLLTK